MTTPDEFIPPDPGEPIPPPAGATDAGAGGVLTEPDDAAALDVGGDEVASLLAATSVGAPTWAQVYALAKSQIAKWAPGRVRENVNDYTQWYYGNNTAAAFCFIFISWVLAHAAKTASAGLALIGGKKAYVPYIRNISGYRAGHSGVRVGAIAAVNSFNHIGFVVRVGSTTFDLLSGNSIYENSDDAITVKTYSLSAMSGYVNLDYAAPSPSPTGWTEKIMSELPSLKQGDTGYAVWTLQGLLNGRCDGKQQALHIDGGFGPATEARVKEEQKQHGIKDDGVVGPHTWSVLILGKDVV